MRQTMRSLLIEIMSMALLSIAVLFFVLGCSNMANSMRDNNGDGIEYDFVCENGEPADGKAAMQNANKCTICDSDYLLIDGKCEVFGFVQPPVLDGTAHANGATLTVTPTHNGTLHWVVYTEGTIITDVATLVCDAADDSSNGVKRSGSAGVLAVAQSVVQIDKTGLVATTAYVVYVALSVQHYSVLSNRLDLDTTAIGVPSFSAKPTTSSIAQTSTDITLSVNEAVDYYWALYATPQTITAARLHSDVAANNGNITGGSGAIALPHDEIIINLTDLNPKSTYYFYALAEDSDNNRALLQILIPSATPNSQDIHGDNPIILPCTSSGVL